MSRVLKRPMFRKGGEVMEGIMTGIKPRESFAIKGIPDSTAENIQSRINLIDAFTGTSPLSDPLTQFLLTSGPALVAGEAAGGTKLQEILGGIKPGLDKATKMQQMKDLSRRKIAASVISKMGTGGLQKYVQQAKDAFRFDTTGELAKRYGNNPEKYALVLFNQDRFRQGKSDATLERESLFSEAASIMKREQDRSKKASYFLESAAIDIAKAKRDLVNSKDFKDGKFNIDNNLYYLPPENTYTPGDKKGVLVPEDTDRLEVGNIYYRKGVWYLFDGVNLTPKFRG